MELLKNIITIGNENLKVKYLMKKMGKYGHEEEKKLQEILVILIFLTDIKQNFYMDKKLEKEQKDIFSSG